MMAEAEANGLATTVTHWARRGRLGVVAIGEFLTEAQGWMVQRSEVGMLIREGKPEVWRELTRDFVYVSE